MGDWDKSLKALVAESPQAFAEWILQEDGLQDLLPASILLAGLVLDKDHLTWLRRRYQQMNDILKESPVYQWMTDDARKEGLEQGLERGRQVEREQWLERLRNTVVEIIAARFPSSLRLAKLLVKRTRSADLLQRAVIKISLAHENDNIDPYLWELDETGEQGEQGGSDQL